MQAKPLEPDALAALLEEYRREGVAMIRGCLEPDEVATIREIADRAFADPDGFGSGFVKSVYTAPILRNIQSLHPFFCEFLVREPFGQIAEALCGPDYVFCGQNVIRSGGEQAIPIWHMDDSLQFPLPDHIPHHDFDVTMPTFYFSLQIALSDIDSEDDGPTQYVPGSHFAGRLPPRNREDPDENDPPTFNGRGPKSVFCKAGDVYVFNHQTWHRGSPNRSGRMRYLMQNQYGQRWLGRRFSSGEHRVCHLPKAQWDGLSERARELLARHT